MMIGKVLLYSFLTIWIIVFCWFGFATRINVPKQIENDKEFVKNQIDPNILLIETFRAGNSRLPTEKEFRTLKFGNTNELGNVDYVRDVNHVDAEIKNAVKNMDWSKNYVLQAWRGDWWEYYISADK